MENDRFSLKGIELKKWLDYSEDEKHEFVHIWAHLKNWLPVDIGLDDDGYYTMNNHPLWIYFKNGYDKKSPWLPLVITEFDCYIPLLDFPLNITNSDYKEVCDFGRIFYSSIKQLADRTISFTYFADSVSNLISLLKESKSLSSQYYLSNLLPKRTGLKYQIWYSAKTEECNPRIVVDLEDGKTLSIQIEDHKAIGAIDQISSEDLNNILKWIDMNQEILLTYWNFAHTGIIDNGDVIDRLKKLE